MTDVTRSSNATVAAYYQFHGTAWSILQLDGKHYVPWPTVAAHAGLAPSYEAHMLTATNQPTLGIKTLSVPLHEVIGHIVPSAATTDVLSVSIDRLNTYLTLTEQMRPTKTSGFDAWVRHAAEIFPDCIPSPAVQGLPDIGAGEILEAVEPLKAVPLAEGHLLRGPYDDLEKLLRLRTEGCTPEERQAIGQLIAAELSALGQAIPTRPSSDA